MDLQLTDRVVVVTGASKGIGLAVTQRFLAEGARVVAASRTRTPALDALAGERLLHVSADLAQPTAPAEVVARALEAFGGIDVLVNNVGGGPERHGPRSSFLAITDADWVDSLELNLLAAVRASRAALPLLLEGGAGAIVNVSSVNARRPYPMVLDYSVAKAALSNLTKGLSEEFAPQRVRVNGISPGPVRTPFWTGDGGMGDAVAGQAGTDRDTALTTVVPELMQLTTGRMVEPEEVAALAALLASPLSANTTGADFVVDSGFLKSL
jgi:NAD(P)-dependent dehydrogenase (short-subunit alcohol dehydrogenase family)